MQRKMYRLCDMQVTDLGNFHYSLGKKESFKLGSLYFQRLSWSNRLYRMPPFIIDYRLAADFISFLFSFLKILFFSCL